MSDAVVDPHPWVEELTLVIAGYAHRAGGGRVRPVTPEERVALIAYAQRLEVIADNLTLSFAVRWPARRQLRAIHRRLDQQPDT